MPPRWPPPWPRDGRSTSRTYFPVHPPTASYTDALPTFRHCLTGPFGLWAATRLRGCRRPHPRLNAPTATASWKPSPCRTDDLEILLLLNSTVLAKFRTTLSLVIGTPLSTTRCMATPIPLLASRVTPTLSPPVAPSNSAGPLVRSRARESALQLRCWRNKSYGSPAKPEDLILPPTPATSSDCNRRT